MDLKEAKILYPLDPGIYNKRVNFLSLNTSSGEIADILSAINFYPCYVPLDQSLITLTVTSDNILNEIKTNVSMENKITYANLHETKRKNDYVSYGTLVSVNVDEPISKLYSYTSWLGLVLDRPQIVNKKYNNYINPVPISDNRYFHINNTLRNSKFEADFSYSNILVEISKDDYHYAHEFCITYFGKIIQLVSLTCRVLQFYGGLKRSQITIAIKKEEYRKLVDSDVGLKIISIYTMYNTKNGDKDFRPLNLVTSIYNLKYSYEELALFVGEITISDGLTIKIEINLSLVQKLKSTLYSNISDSLEISMDLQASTVTWNNNTLTIIVIKPEIIIKLITAYIFTSNSSVKKVLESKDVYKAVINFYNRIYVNNFDDDGNLIPSNIISYLKS